MNRHLDIGSRRSYDRKYWKRAWLPRQSSKNSGTTATSCGMTCLRADTQTGSEQLTFLLFLKMADKRSQ